MKLQFGLLLKSLRNNFFLPGKHTPITQDGLSEISDVNVNIIKAIEGGHKAKILFSDIQKISDALRLTTAERKEFLFAAFESSKADEKLRVDPDVARNILNKIEKVIIDINLPAFILDVFGNIVAANSIIVDLYNLSGLIKNLQNDESVTRYHFLDLFFSDEHHFPNNVSSSTREQIILANIQFFRRISLRHRYKWQFEAIFEELAQNQHFDRYWHLSCRSNEDYDDSFTFYDYSSPDHGNLKYYAFDVVNITDYDELYLIIYLPADADTSARFMEIASRGNRIFDISKWPMVDL